MKKMAINIGDLIINKFIFANENKNLNFFLINKIIIKKLEHMLFLFAMRKNLIN